VPPKRQRKVRVELRKNRNHVARQNDLTRQLRDAEHHVDHVEDAARMSGKGALTRKRTVLSDAAGGRVVDASLCKPGRVLRAIGATQCWVQDEASQTVYECSVRRMLRTLASDERSAVVAGDRVLFQPLDATRGVIERVEPRAGVLSRGHQRREHVLVANVTQVMIVASAAEPALKPALIDRFIVSAAKGGVAAAICLNKCDLVDLVELQPIIGLYSRLGYPVVPTSTVDGTGIVRLRQRLVGHQTVFTGQSGVGKSSLLNAVQPGLALRTGDVSQVTQKGRHTTRSAELLQLHAGGWVVDTPGIRQLALWDVSPGEVEGYFVEFHPFVPKCRYPNCLHLEEDACAVRQAVRDDLISRTRYESYVRLVLGDV
jgi:ribosome biogenesis GTPase